jgi:hypothetical protein
VHNNKKQANSVDGLIPEDIDMVWHAAEDHISTLLIKADRVFEL